VCGDGSFLPSLHAFFIGNTHCAEKIFLLWVLPYSYLKAGGTFMQKAKGILSVLLAFIFIFMSSGANVLAREMLYISESHNSTENFLRGDVDNDGRLTLADATHLRNFLIASCRDSFLASRPFFNVSNADVDGNGVVNTTDLTMLRWLMEVSGNDIPAGSDLITLHIMPRDTAGFPVFPAQIELYVNNIRSVHQTRGLSIPFLIPEGSSVFITASAEDRRTVSREINNFNSANAMQTIILQSDSDPIDPHDPSDPNNPRLFPLSRPAFQSSILVSNEAIPHIYLTFPGGTSHAVILESTYPTIAQNPTIVGKGVEVSLSGSITSGYILFDVGNSYKLHELAIVRYDIDTKALHPLETTLDSSGRFRAHLDGDGHYFVINIAEFLNYLGVDMDAILGSSHSQMALPFEIENISTTSPSALNIGACGHTFEDYCVDSPATFTGAFTDSELPEDFNTPISGGDYDFSSIVNTSALGMTESLVNETHTFEFTGNIQSINLPPGRFLLEVWGAQGGTAGQSLGGRGGYSRGEIILENAQTIFVGVGGQHDNGGFNGGGTSPNNNMTHGGAGGGGATHVAIRDGILANFVNSRDDVLIVAGGGGGGDRSTHLSGGVGGGLEGGNNGFANTGGTQSRGGIGLGSGSGGVNGSFGRGGSTPSALGGGGGGWYGGSTGFDRPGFGLLYNAGGGGSGYVRSDLTESETIRGDETMPNPNGGEMIGREGHGFARITDLDSAWITLKGGLRVRLDSYPCPNDLITSTANDGIPDSEKLVFPPVDVNLREFLVHFLAGDTSAPDVFVKMYDYYINPAHDTPNDGFDFPEDMEWQVFSHDETDTEFLISTEPVPSFGAFENVLIGITRFMGNPNGDVYVLDDDEWHFMGQTPIVNIGMMPAAISLLPHLLSPVFNWLKTSATEIQYEVENPFKEDYFGDFTWQRILASSTIANADTATYLNIVGAHISSLRAVSMITPNSIDRIRAWEDEWDKLQDAELPNDAFAPFLGRSLVTELQNIIRTLSSADGVSLTNFRVSQAVGFAAAGEAEVRFGGNTVYPQKYDTFRHWAWNFDMAGLPFGRANARIIATNHEWAPMIHHSVTERHQELLDELRLSYPNANMLWIAKEAYVKSLAYSVYFRNNEIERIGDNFDLFQRYFHDDFIMDFWNNETGRQDRAKLTLFNTRMNIFNDSWETRRLVRDIPSVTDETRRIIFDEGLWHN
jgi:hypothetical protein